MDGSYIHVYDYTVYCVFFNHTPLDDFPKQKKPLLIMEPSQYQTMIRYLQGGAPPNYKWVIIPLIIDISPINHSYGTYKPT